ncbi:MAG: hypothetical protein DRN64_03000 [Thaumarchaeota archaeon]|nr:MAG: hypothetical protein DRN64_03000 [Nitrososphaerota archaeon]
MKKSQNYFLISVSNRKNLELCMKYALAGFTNSINGLWTYLDIEEGDYISFLYGARVRNLYKVIKKVAYKNAENLPPWPPVTFKMSGNTYYFPFRLFLKQEREFDEPMVRPEFSYVAENLLLRGGYRKTHFQADTITFYNVSEMGKPFDGRTDSLDLKAETFEPKITFRREFQKIPEKFYFKELILQSLVRKKMRDLIFNEILNHFNIDNKHDEFEILGEKALPEGFVDIFIKLKHPAGRNKYILVEVKTGRAQKRDIVQLKNYLREFSDEAVGGVLIAKDFPKRLPDESKVLPVKYHFSQLNEDSTFTYKELLNLLHLEVIT